MSSLSSKNLLNLISLANFFFTLNLAVSAYIGSSFLAAFVGTEKVGFIYALSASFTVIAIFLAPYLLKHSSISFLGGLFSIAAFFSLFILSTVAYFPVVLVSFIAYYILGVLVRFILDIYLENCSTDSRTGRIRGYYLTIANTAWLMAPFIAGLLAGINYSLVYTFSALATIPAIFIISHRLKLKEEPEYSQKNLGDAVSDLWQARKGKKKNIYQALWLDLFLNLFYAVMVIYMPLYLNSVIGFSWPEIGIIFTFMLLPFVFLQYPLGKIADLWLGEKEIMTVAIIVISLSSIIASRITTSSIVLWAAVLFLSRVGAASLEIMKEAYLFKQIDERDAIIISLSRNAMPLSYIFAPVLASLFLYFGQLQNLFLALGIVLLPALYFSITLKDTG